MSCKESFVEIVQKANVFPSSAAGQRDVFGGHVIFCAYPGLTLQYLARVNPAVAYSGRMGMNTMDAVQKYGVRRFHYLGWPENAKVWPDAPYCTRSVTNRFSVWVDTTDVLSVRISYQDLWNGCQVVPGGWDGWLSCVCAFTGEHDRRRFMSGYVDSTKWFLTRLTR